MTAISLLDPSAVDDIAARHPAVFSSTFADRLRKPLILAGIGLYLVFAWWFFSVGAVLANGNWNIAGSYLADWISYEIRPDVKFEGDYLDVTFPRFSPLGANPDPAWMEWTRETVERRVEPAAAQPEGGSGGRAAPAGSFMAPGTSFMAPDAPTGGAASDEPAAASEPRIVEEEVVTSVDLSIGDAVFTVVAGLVTIDYRGETLELAIVPDVSVTPRGPLPSWAEQPDEGGDVELAFGFAGSAEVESDEIKVRHRFLGWENFLFDTNSPYWGMSLGEVAGTILSGERIEPDMSNLALAWNNILYNAEWQHGDVWIKLFQTIVMAFVGTVFATILAFPLAFAAARNITPNRFVNQALKRLFDFLRCVDMLIWALFFTRAFGPGPLAGISAIFFTDTGTLGKLYSEALENIDDKQREGIRSVGAGPLLVQRYGVVPQVLPVFISQSLYFWESNTRSATIIGAVGAGGIGLKLWEAMRTNTDWENVAYMVILILVTVFLFDAVSNAIRSRLVERRS